MQALGIAASDFDCYLSDVETTYHGEDFAPHDQWISGPELLRLDERNEIQFNWAVFSAVTVGLRPTVLAAPYIEGNQDTGRVPRSSRKCPKRSLKSYAGTAVPPSWLITRLTQWRAFWRSSLNRQPSKCCTDARRTPRAPFFGRPWGQPSS